MRMDELAQEFAMTDEAAAQLCVRLAIRASLPSDEISEADAERFRAAARADLDPGSGDDVAAGWAAPSPTGAWAPPTNGHGGDRGPGPRPGSGSPVGSPGQPSWARSADLARLDAARRRATSYVNSGYALLALGLLITLATIALAPGGFFIVSFGTVFIGFRRLRAGRMMRAQIRQAEQQLGPD